MRRLLPREDGEMFLESHVLIEAATRNHRVSLDGVLDELRERLLSSTARPLVLARLREGAPEELWFLIRFLEPVLTRLR